MLLLVWLTLQWGILPRIERWRPQIEAWATQAVGIEVRIAAIEVAGGLWSPMLTLQDVRLIDRAGRDALRLESVRALLVPRSLLPVSLTRWEPSFEQLVVEHPQLDVRRDAAGQIWVAGLPLGSSAGGDRRDNAAADWLFSQREVVLRQGRLSWTDETRSAPTLALADVTLVLRNTLARHRLRLDATPPPEWGDRFSLQADLRQSFLAAASGLQHRGDWRGWRGQLYASVPLVDVHSLHQHVDLPVALQGGRAALQAWLQFDQGQLTGGSANVALRDVAMRLGHDLEPLALTTLGARIDAQAQRRGAFGRVEPARLDIRQLAFETGDGVQWPSSDLTMTLQSAPTGVVQGGSVEASRLELHVLAGLATRLPLAGPMRKLIDQVEPQGRIEQLKLRWQGTLEAPTSFSTTGQAFGLHLVGAATPQPADAATSHSLPGRPGVRNADVDFEFTERSGTARLRVQNGALELPGVFEEPLLPLAQLAAEVRWRVDPAKRPAVGPAVSVEVRNAQFANADAQGTLDAHWQTGAARSPYLPGQLELNARLTRADAARVFRYLPLGLPETTRHYVRDAVRSGQASLVTARVRGDLHDFPFAKAGSGEFQVRAQLQNAEFAYVPDPEHPWPVFTNTQAELVFDRQSLQIHKGQARLGSLGSGAFALSEVEGGIADLLHQPTLRIEGRGHGLAADALAYVRGSPLSRLLGHALDPASATGNTDLTLALAVPLQQADHTEVRGSVELAGNTVQMRPDVPTLADVRAKVDFSHEGFSVAGGGAKALGGSLVFDGSQQRDGTIRFTGQGTASAEGLRRAAEVPVLAELGSQLTGQAGYRLQLGFLPGGHTEMTVTSSLAGIGSRLPVPLAKTEGDTWPLRVSFQPQTSAAATAGLAAGTLRELLRVEIAMPGGAPGSPPLLDAQYLRDTGSDGTTRVVRGAVGLGAPASLPGPQEAAGTVVATVVLPQLSLDAWSDWRVRYAATPSISGLSGTSGTSGSGAIAGATTVASTSLTAGSPEAYLPSRATLRTVSLTAQGQRLSNVVATVTRDPGFDGPRPVTDWLIDVTADQLGGRVELRDGGSGASASSSRLKARLTRLALTKDSGLDTAIGNPVRASTASTIDRLPAVDLGIDELLWQGKSLGKLELVAANRGDGSRESPREWRISKLALTLPEAQLSAVGNWAPGATGTLGARRTALSFALDIQDSGRLLDRMGFVGTVRSGSGQLKGQLGWAGPPTEVNWPSLNGTLRLDLDKGQFLHAEPGVARLLGVLSLQSLPRRLLFDFSDVFKEGFSFDHIDGDATISQGVASTRNLRIRSVQATVLTEGTADLLRETQDLHVWVVPDFNAGAASLAYAAINPVIGLGTLLGQFFLRKPLAEAATRQFHVTGRWDAPQVDPVARENGRPSPAQTAAPLPADAQASSPSTP